MTSLPRSACVFCGSARGTRPALAEAARALGEGLARADIELVYGGASVGLMGILADAALAAGGRVTGVIPRALVDREVAHAGLTELVVVSTMHERKRAMFDRSEAFVSLPGGYGTLDETFEMLTWAQLGDHRKPCVLVDVDGFFDDLLRFLDRAVSDGLLRPAHRQYLKLARSVDEALERLAEPVPALRPKVGTGAADRL